MPEVFREFEDIIEGAIFCVSVLHDVVVSIEITGLILDILDEYISEEE